MKKNIVTLTDSYKMTHHNQYPEGTEYVYSYFEARPGSKFDKTTFFGLQYLIKNWLLGEVVTKEGIDRAEKLTTRHFGNDKVFNRARWDYIVEEHNGRLPIEIKAVKEGSVIPIDNVMMTVVNTDPNCHWLTNHLETLLCQVWYPSTVATLSRTLHEMFDKYLDDTSDSKDGIDFMLHDFGMRGTSSMESAGIGGAGHLLNFLGTDTVIAMEYIEEYYGGIETGFSIPATEHSVMTAQGREGERAVIQQLLDNHPTGLLSVVSDSYDIYNCVDKYYGVDFKEQILAREGKFVVRPDSGNPVKVVCGSLDIQDWSKYLENYKDDQEVLDIELKKFIKDVAWDTVTDETPHGERGDDYTVIKYMLFGKVYEAKVEIDWNRYDKQYYYVDGADIEYNKEIELTLEDEGLLNILYRRFGGTINSKGYKVLNPKVGLIWGDGIDIAGINRVLEAAKKIGFAAENLVFGMGGGLLQKINRDTQRFAFKSSAQMRNGVWHDVYKDPIDGSKSSKRGRLVLLQNEEGEFVTSALIEGNEKGNLLETVYLNGELLIEYDFDEVRANSKK